jgi:hypothetical protein
VDLGGPGTRRARGSRARMPSGSTPEARRHRTPPPPARARAAGARCRARAPGALPPRPGPAREPGGGGRSGEAAGTCPQRRADAGPATSGAIPQVPPGHPPGSMTACTSYRW